jgi:molybdenum ABC transporter molybdate-binding protein
VLIFGASGAFFTQITHDAPFQVFLSADQERAKAAIDGGYAVASSLFTYAIGKLVLWSRVIDVTNGEEALKAGNFAKLSIPNRRRALRARRDRDDEGARRLRRPEAQSREWQQHRAGVPVRRYQER